MRPLHLTMSAFGCYTGRVDIDMDALGREGLYLICGDTGAGKSTIFDGICFALYGQTSGSARRDGEVLRSELAGPGVKSFVELTFEHAGQRYGVWRSLKYARPALRGRGMIQEESGAAITLPDGSVLEGKRRVNEKVEEILRLKYEHFSRIMMIAQGEFSQLLMADTEARGRILQKICDTTRHRALQERLIDQAKALEGARLPLAEKVKGAFAYAECGEDSPHRPALEALKAEPSVYKGRELVDILTEIAAEDDRILTGEEKREKDFRARAERLNAALAQLEALSQSRQALKQAENQLAQERERLPALAKAQEELLARREQMEGQEAQAARIEAQLPDYLALERDAQALEKLGREREDLAKQIAQAQAGVQQDKRQLDEAEAQIAALAGAPAALLAADSQAQALLEKGKAAARSVEQAEQLMEAEAELRQDQEKLALLAEQARRRSESLARMRQDLLLHQAGILATGLQEGAPCPVCGATHHPTPAPLPQAAPTQEQVRMAEEAAAQGDKAAQNLAGQVKQALGRVEAGRAQLEQALAGQQAALAPGMALREMRDQAVRLREGLRLDYQKIQFKRKLAQEQVAKLERLQGERPRRQQALEQKNQALHDARAQAARLEGNCAALTQAVAARREALPFESQAQAQGRMLALRRETARYRQAVEQAAQALNQCANRIETDRSQIALLKGQIEKQTEVLNGEEEQTIRMRQREAEEALRQCMQKRSHLQGRLARNEKCAAGVGVALREFEALEEQCAVARSLADTAAGRLKGCDKLTFERYIQIAYFERVLTMANQRFLQMTLGQYELERAQEAESLRSQAGLELNVVNHFTGARRSVKSLSGGESFMASLSLALGFADVIRQEAGGVVIDALFIDEGFGALDEAALEQVLSALTHLSGGGKLIGIISHVAQLRQRIERQILVRKGRGGSTVQVLC